MIDYYYVDRILPYFENYRTLGRSPLRIQCRCIVCGDSKSNSRKMRGYFLERRDDPGKVNYMCHNCGCSYSLWSLIKLHFPELSNQYRLDRFKPKQTFKKELVNITSTTLLPSVKEEVDEEEYSWTAISDLDKTHPVVRYLKYRGVSNTKDFFYTDSFRLLSNQIAIEPPFSDGALFYEHPRIVTRVVNDGVLQGIIGRSISKKQEPRYLIIKALDEATMLFNYDNVDKTKPIFITEGVYDCVILSNAVAQLGLTKTSAVEHIPNRVWCLDNEPRSGEVVDTMRMLVELGESVVLWNRLPSNLRQYKDLSSMYTDGKASKEFLDDFVNSNIYSGESALIELVSWAKVPGRQKQTRTKSTVDILNNFKQKHWRNFND